MIFINFCLIINMLLKDLAKKEDKGNKKIANKRKDFRRQARTNYFIHNNRLYYK